MNTSLASKIDLLKDRASLLRKARAFFAERNVLEVDCPALSQAAPIDLHIDVMSVALPHGKKGYLHTSPEYGMKRLLAASIGDIFQISHVFRQEEISPLHNPEFTMVEWYRLQLNFDELIQETCEFAQLFLGGLPVSSLRYRDALLHYAGIDYVHARPADLIACAKRHRIDLPSDAAAWDKDTLLQLLTSLLVEPHLGQGKLEVLCDYPASQAALAKTKTVEDETAASRFELYYKGIELANGYDELIDPQEQRLRLESASRARLLAGKDPLKIDENFLSALESGLPDCRGVAVGFDRLMLLRHKKASLRDILPFSWEEA